MNTIKYWIASFLIFLFTLTFKNNFVLAQGSKHASKKHEKRHNKPLPKKGKEYRKMQEKSMQIGNSEPNADKIFKPKMQFPKKGESRNTSVPETYRPMNPPNMGTSTGDLKTPKKNVKSILEIRDYKGESDLNKPNTKLPIRGIKETTVIDKGRPRNQTNLSQGTGDVKVPKKNVKSILDMKDYKGDAEMFMPSMKLPKAGIENGLTVIDNAKEKRQNASTKQREYKGDQKYIDFKQVRKDRSRTVSSSVGDNDNIDISVLDNIKSKRAEKSEKQREYSGDMDNYLENRADYIKDKSKKQREYSGDMDNYLENRADFIKDKSKKQREYSGDMNNYLENRADYIKKKSKKMSAYSGDILVSTLKKKEQKIRSKSKDMANYEGDIVIAKRTKGMHPSSSYTSARVRGSYADRVKYRKRMINRLRKNRDIEEPEYFKIKQGKPKYDDQEYKIWQYERK